MFRRCTCGTVRRRRPRARAVTGAVENLHEQLRRDCCSRCRTNCARRTRRNRAPTGARPCAAGCATASAFPSTGARCRLRTSLCSRARRVASHCPRQRYGAGTTSSVGESEEWGSVDIGRQFVVQCVSRSGCGRFIISAGRAVGDGGSVSPGVATPGLWESARSRWTLFWSTGRTGLRTARLGSRGAAARGGLSGQTL